MRIGQCIWYAGFGPTMPRVRPGRSHWEGCVFGSRKFVRAWNNVLDAGLAWAGVRPATFYMPQFNQECARLVRSSVSTSVGELKDEGGEALAGGLRELMDKMRELNHELARPDGLRNSAGEAPAEATVCDIRD